MEKIILASSSPRRKMLLEQIGVSFETIPSNIDEESIMDAEVSPYDAVKSLSTQKAMRVAMGITEEAIVIAADTVVSVNGHILGKPADEDAAYAMLKRLQGKVHSVYTGVSIVKKTTDGMQLKNIVDTTSVYMRKLTEKEIEAYIKTGEPFDKAGAYAIQGMGSVLIEKIEGDYFNVVGLPVVKLYIALRDFGVDLSEYWL